MQGEGERERLGAGGMDVWTLEAYSTLLMDKVIQPGAFHKLINNQEKTIKTLQSTICIPSSILKFKDEFSILTTVLLLWGQSSVE